MSRHSERNAVRHRIESNEPPAPARPDMRGLKPHEAIAKRIKQNYDDANQALPERLMELLAELNQLPASPKKEP